MKKYGSQILQPRAPKEMENDIKCSLPNQREFMVEEIVKEMPQKMLPIFP
jgi:hypothetical protein